MPCLENLIVSNVFICKDSFTFITLTTVIINDQFNKKATTFGRFSLESVSMMPNIYLYKS